MASWRGRSRCSAGREKRGWTFLVSRLSCWTASSTVASVEASRRLLRLRLLDYAAACPVQSLHNSLPLGSECVGMCVDRVFKFLVFVFLVKKTKTNKAKRRPEEKVVGGRGAQDARKFALRLGVVDEMGDDFAARTSCVFIVGCEASGGAVGCRVWFV